MIRPSLDATIELMRELSEDCDLGVLDLLAAAEYVNFDHQSISDEYSTKHGWGLCETCQTRWPCRAWINLETALTEWLIRSSGAEVNRVTR
jgi:hypothetical protein